MLFFSPLKFFIFPFVFVVALPLALCAGATTILAFLVLFLRLFLVYFDVGLETLRYVLVGHATQGRYIASPTNTTAPPSPATATFRHRRRMKRQGSSGSGSMTPVPGFDGLSAVTPSIGLERDFEGVGGWRLEAADEQQWYNLNSRLENPYRRHHFRSQSGGAVLSGPTATRPSTAVNLFSMGSRSPESAGLTPSPNRSGTRTPTIHIKPPQGFTKADQDGYFPIYEGKNMKKIGFGA
ncbi:hypothetical protein F4777DRAFT_542253 [Nemania sp. FL0916]|nr:hypothetical protein F4777DRAFT_542253 [Nemania sp. FL0916]